MRIRPGVWLVAAMLMVSMGCTSGDPIEELIEHLRSDFGNQREQACKRLGQLGPEAAKAVPALRKILRTDQSDYVRRCAADALGKMAPVGAAAFPELTRAFKDRAGGVRMAAAEALGRYKEKALPILKQLIHGKDGHMQLYALRSLKHLGPQALPLLAYAAQSKYLQVLQTTSETLIEIGRKSFSPPKTDELRKAHGAYFKTLFVLLKVRNAKIRRHVSWALSELGPYGAEASTALCEQLIEAMDGVLESAPNQVKMYAAYALRQLGKHAAQNAQTRRHLQGTKSWSSALERLLALRQDQSWYIRKHAISALGWLLEAMAPIGKQAKQATYTKQYKRYLGLALDGMAAMLDDPTWDVRYEVTRALRRIGGARSLEIFLQGLRSPNPERREHSAQTLGWMGQQALRQKQHLKFVQKQVIPALHQALHDRRADVKKAAEAALVALGELAAASLVQAHTKGTTALRLRRYRVLGKIGKKVAAKSSQSLWQWATRADKEPLLQKAALSALRQMLPLSPGACQSLPGQLDDTKKERDAALSLGRCPLTPALLNKLWQSAAKTGDVQVRARLWVTLGALASTRPTALTKAQQAQVASWWSLAKDPIHQRTLILAMGWLSPRPVAAWASLLTAASQHTSQKVRGAAITTLLQWPWERGVQAQTQKLAQDRVAAIRLRGLRALGRMLPLKGAPQQELHKRWQLTTSQTLPLLEKQSRHRDASTRVAALKVQGALPLVYGLSSIPTLLKASQDRDAQVRAEACHGLAWQTPLVVQNGWLIPFLQASLKSPNPAMTIQQVRALAHSSRKRPDKGRLALEKRFPGQELVVARTKKLNPMIYKALQARMTDSSAQVRKQAIFALGHLGPYANSKEQQVILRILLGNLKGKQKPFVKQNICWMLGRWIAPDHNAEMIQKMRKVQLDPGQPKATRAQCEAAIYQLKSDDQPYVLWVNHPRSPTLETFASTNLYPQGP